MPAHRRLQMECNSGISRERAWSPIIEGSHGALGIFDGVMPCDGGATPDEADF